MRDFSPISGYSPPIRITLEIEGRHFEVAEVGGEHIALREPEDWGPVNGLLLIRIDESELRYRVSLPHGIDSMRDRQPILLGKTVAC
jgi:hypothetical protein